MRSGSIVFWNPKVKSFSYKRILESYLSLYRGGLVLQRVDRYNIDEAIDDF